MLDPRVIARADGHSSAARGPPAALDILHSPGVGFWATPELLEFYGTPNMDYAFSFLARFLAKSSLFLAFCAFFASRRVLLAHEAGGQPDGDAHPRHSRLPPARDTAQPCSSSRALSRPALARAVFALHSLSSSTTVRDCATTSGGGFVTLVLY